MNAEKPLSSFIFFKLITDILNGFSEPSAKGDITWCYRNDRKAELLTV